MTGRVVEREGLKGFSRTEVLHMLELIDRGRRDPKYGLENVEWLLRLKHKLLKYSAMCWSDGKIMLPKNQVRNNV